MEDQSSPKNGGHRTMAWKISRALDKGRSEELGFIIKQMFNEPKSN